MIVGEAPGAEEERQGIPFVGPTGAMVDQLLGDNNVKRSEVYLTNVVKVRPPNNSLKDLKLIGYKIDDFLPQLWEEINLLKPNCILALGNTALEQLTSHRGIEKYRGSILTTTQGFPKVVPSIHPASLLHKDADSKLRSWKDLTFIRWDFARAIKESQTHELELPHRNLIVCKSNIDLYRFFSVNSNKTKVSVDIETFRTIPICISFAFDRHCAISVPLFNTLTDKNHSGMTKSDQIQCWKDIAEILANSRIQKIGQNFKFDSDQLEHPYNRTINFGLKVRGFFFDTQLAFRTLYCELPASLGFIASVLTREPYYKDEGKEYNPKKDKLDKLLLYNAKDAVVTFEAYEEESRELEERGLTDFFYQRVMPFHPFYREIESRGILRDNFQKNLLSEKYKDRQLELTQELEGLIGVTGFNPASPKQVGVLLFEVLKIPLRKGTDEKTLDALMRNTVKDTKKKRIIELILEIRKVRKTIGTYINSKAHPDGRLRTQYRLMLETGRTSTNVCKPPTTTEVMGLAFQTITKHGEVGADLRSQFIPDVGHVFLEPDLSGAEARVVAILSRDARLIKIFKYNIDVHRVTTGWIEGNCPDELLNRFYLVEDHEECIELAKKINKMLKGLINDEQRQIGKKFRHAGNYDMQKRTASENASVSEWRAGQILERFHSTNPGVQQVFHREIRECLQSNDRKLVNPFGRERQFLNRWGDELFKEAYAQIPQSTVSDHLKFSMIKIASRAPWLRIVQESHDSFLSLCPKNMIEASIPIIKSELESPIDFSRCSLPRGELIIPCEISLGEKNWLEMRKIA